MCSKVEVEPSAQGKYENLSDQHLYNIVAQTILHTPKGQRNGDREAWRKPSPVLKS